MNLSEGAASYPSTKRNRQHCDSCGTLLSAPGFFCVRCGPPESPEPDPEKGLRLSHACLRIALLALVFIVIAVFKLEINPLRLFHDSGSDEVFRQVAEDEDYKIFFTVNVSFANLRDEPNAKTSTILSVLTRGTQVEILAKEGTWSRIRSKPGPKKLSRTGWLASRFIDSEIK